MGHFCHNHIGDAVKSAAGKATEGSITVKRDTGNCAWSGCPAPTVDIYLLEYVKDSSKVEQTADNSGGDKPTPTEETPQTEEQKVTA